MNSRGERLGLPIGKESRLGMGQTKQAGAAGQFQRLASIGDMVSSELIRNVQLAAQGS